MSQLRFTLAAPLWVAAIFLPALAPAAEAPTKAATAAPAAPAAPAGPMELLRSRLADRLTAGKGGDAGGSRELRIVAKAAASPGPTAAPAAVSHGATPRSASAAPRSAVGAPRGAAAGPKGADPHAHWDYDGPAGPQAWGGSSRSSRCAAAASGRAPSISAAAWRSTWSP